MVEVRVASVSDAESILEIYAPFIISKATTFEADVPSVNEFKKRIEHYLIKYPWLVCTVNKNIAGYVYASPFKDREAYQWSAECSVYMHPQFKGKGIAKEMYEVLFYILKYQGIRNVFAGITLPNDASIHLHEKFGFTLNVIYENVGYKLGAWHNVGWWKLQLNEYSPEPPPPFLFSEINSSIYKEKLDIAARVIEQHYLFE